MDIKKKVMSRNAALTIRNFHSDDTGDQKKRDRAIRESRQKSNRKYENLKCTQLCKIKLAKYLINDLENYGPTGLIHMNALSSVIGRPIRVWKSGGGLYRTINNDKNESAIQHPVDVEYHEEAPNCIGHWTLPGNKDPVDVETDLNSCLFTVIAAQIGKTTKDLRANTIDFLTNNTKNLIGLIDNLLYSNDNKTSLMIGGARYVGTSAREAALVLDKSQNTLCYGCRDYGHPRGHASDKDATGPKDSVENYSRTTGNMKSGFLSRRDQNDVAHIALSHTRAQEAMRSLNHGATSKSITLSRRELQTANYELPKMKEYYNGAEYSGELDIIRVTVVLRHHQDKFKDPNADVFVHTLYPRAS